jgi:hypothetical protein
MTRSAFLHPYVPSRTVRWCLVVMKFDEDLNARLSKWIATSRKRLALTVAMLGARSACSGRFCCPIATPA